ncbi:hypothetical protein MKX03_005521 [Papaver bracteatum]|nr:hypothetical protein MKX03_005521 [Papaver bracteatum]
MGGGLNTRTNQEGLRRWVWAANPNNPVTENSTLTFSPDGNLILADTNGRAVWETHTANKGVTDIKLLCNGNLVLLDSNGKFVWQSFRYPTDTLLNGQGLVARGSNRLVSGSYSLDVGQYIFPTLLFKNKNNPPMEYHSLFFPGDGYQIVRFLAVGNQFGLAYAAGDHGNTPAGKDMWAQVAYNTTLSMLRLEKDGKLFVYTYNGYTKTWERVFSYFLSITGECKLPQKCGVFGLCKNQKCISCPSSKGIMAASWNKECIREKIPDCKNATSKADYYKIPSVYSSIGSYSNYQDYKKLTVNECKNKCSKDCRCTAFLYQKDRGTCLVATTEIYTLSSDPFRNGLGNLVHPDDAYIKYAK